MKTIKGPIKLGGNNKVPKEIADVVATNLGINLGKTVAKPKEVKNKPKLEYTEEELEKKDFSEIKEIGYKYKVKGRSKKGLIRDILGRIAGTKEAEL